MALILIADDDELLCTRLAGQLSSVGHGCHAETDGERALERLQRHQYDLLVLDIMLPGLSGFEICRRIHADPRLYHLPILFISAMNAEEEIAHGLAQGADDYLTKPFAIETFMARVNGLLAMTGQNLMADEMTALPGPKGIKLEIQKAVGTRQPFALAYAELIRLNEFGRMTGADARQRAIRHLARALAFYGERLQSEPFKTGHMGGGHFVCILDPAYAQAYCQKVRTLWQRHLPEFYAAIGHPDLEKKSPNNGLDVMICVTFCEGNGRSSANKLFDILTRLRQYALTCGGAGVYIDQRH